MHDFDSLDNFNNFLSPEMLDAIYQLNHTAKIFAPSESMQQMADWANSFKSILPNPAIMAALTPSLPAPAAIDFKSIHEGFNNLTLQFERFSRSPNGYIELNDEELGILQRGVDAACSISQQLGLSETEQVEPSEKIVVKKVFAFKAFAKYSAELSLIMVFLFGITAFVSGCQTGAQLEEINSNIAVIIDYLGNKPSGIKPCQEFSDSINDLVRNPKTVYELSQAQRVLGNAKISE